MKKFISLILIISIVLCCLTSMCTWAEVICPDLNDKGQIANIKCAMDLGKEQILEGKKSYIKMDNIGKNSEYTLYFFEPKEISQLLKRFSAPITLDTFDAQDQSIKQEQKENTNKIIEKISSFKNGLSSIFKTSSFVWTCYVVADNFDAIRNVFGNNFDNRRGNAMGDLRGNAMRGMRGNAMGDLRGNAMINLRGNAMIDLRDDAIRNAPVQLIDPNFNRGRNNVHLLLPKFLISGVLALLSGATTLLGNFISSIFINKNSRYINEDYKKRLKSYEIEDINYFSALEKIITNIKFNLFNINKFLCLRLNNDPDKYKAEVFLFDNEKAQYTESEKIKFNKDMEALKKDIEEILAKK